MGTPSSDRSVKVETSVAASRHDTWEAWTTPAGVKSFFAPACNVELRVHGPYEILFFPDAPPGQRGAEGTMVLAFQPEKMFAFTWGTPPFFPTIFEQRLHVVVRLDETAPKETRVILVHDGWGEGGEWDTAFDFFKSAWEEVLTRLKERFARGPIDWSVPEEPARLRRRWTRSDAARSRTPDPKA